MSLGGVVYHVTNRGSRKGILFASPRDYLSFVRLVAEAVVERPMRVIAYCLMFNHWHFLLWPEHDGDLPRFMHWLTTSHAGRLRAASGTRGEGAVYQSRYYSKPIVDNAHLLSTWRYVERNPLEAKLVERAELWQWSSAAPRTAACGPLQLTSAPCERPADWLNFVNDPDNFPLTGV